MALNNTSNPFPDGFATETTEWSFEEKQLFEMAIRLCDMESNSQVELMFIQSFLPHKSLFDIQKHYQKYEEDIQDIDAGVYDDDPISDSLPQVQKSKKVAHWTKDEHMLFLMGLKDQGRKWKIIAENYVKTKNHIQVASHAQKYFKRQQEDEESRKKRRSIHDITTETLHHMQIGFGCEEYDFCNHAASSAKRMVEDE